MRERDQWTAYGGAIVPSRKPHTMDALGIGVNAVLVVEPQTSDERALTDPTSTGGSTPSRRHPRRALVRPLRRPPRERGRGFADGAARRVVSALTGGVEPHVVSDARGSPPRT